eukprot:gene23870-biopygen10396
MDCICYATHGIMSDLVQEWHAEEVERRVLRGAIQKTQGIIKNAGNHAGYRPGMACPNVIFEAFWSIFPAFWPPKLAKSGLKHAPQRRGYTRSLPMGPIDGTHGSPEDSRDARSAAKEGRTSRTARTLPARRKRMVRSRVDAVYDILFRELFIYRYPRPLISDGYTRARSQRVPSMVHTGVHKKMVCLVCTGAAVRACVHPKDAYFLEQRPQNSAMALSAMLLEHFDEFWDRKPLTCGAFEHPGPATGWAGLGAHSMIFLEHFGVQTPLEVRAAATGIPARAPKGFHRWYTRVCINQWHFFQFAPGWLLQRACARTMRISVWSKFGAFRLDNH